MQIFQINISNCIVFVLLINIRFISVVFYIKHLN